ncbi:MAG: division/cell wall cluster transcriptional repressor MraZ [Alphaproteobacteria bacterium]
MALFLSTIVNKLDKKGRVSVPASFRSALEGEAFAGVALFRSLHLPTIEGMGSMRLQQLSESLDGNDIFAQSSHDLADCVFADAQMLGFDSEGRIAIPPAFLAYARIKEQLAFVGRGATFQIWDFEAFQEHQEKARQRLRDNPLALNLSIISQKGA